MYEVANQGMSGGFPSAISAIPISINYILSVKGQVAIQLPKELCTINYDIIFGTRSFNLGLQNYLLQETFKFMQDLSAMPYSCLLRTKILIIIIIIKASISLDDDMIKSYKWIELNNCERNL